MRSPTGVRPSAFRVFGEAGSLVVAGDNHVDYPHTIERDAALAPLAAAAHALAEREWHRPLYDPAALARNQVPVAARAYAGDMFVPPDLSLATAEATEGVRVILDETNHHDGLRRGPLDELVAPLPERVHPDLRPVMIP